MVAIFLGYQSDQEGSVLGLLLFIIYVTDIYLAIADDLALHREVYTLDDWELVQNDLANFASCSQQWQLQLNWNKCEAINTTNKQDPLLFLYNIHHHPI